MSWGFLFCAAVFEILWAVCIHYSKGFSNLTPSLLAIVFAIISFTLLTLSVKTIPIGIAYAIWTGLGILGATIFSLYIGGGVLHTKQMIFSTLILVGVIGLTLTQDS